ncbi:hypothetical protein AGRA3207_004490 [Actinomadura graeca]|uniref:DUF3039 domain-containing protein n=1 Tax=Actinomadura graeca TaxID=2750812 RepID=A0ABX8R2X0_9ACTN|nr:hypothetical protein [Actinomadura graeca]QXJ23348.1 hypothetical protein AGRA3207_004490 [Actinomadura graeca]
MEDDELLAVAEAVRPEVSTLAGAGTAARFEALLASLRRGEPAGDDLFELLTGDTALRERLNSLSPPPPEGVHAFAYLDLPKHEEVTAATMYACPHRDYRYPAQEIGEAVPLCPKHHLPLRAE